MKKGINTMNCSKWGIFHNKSPLEGSQIQITSELERGESGLVLRSGEVGRVSVFPPGFDSWRDQGFESLSWYRVCVLCQCYWQLKLTTEALRSRSRSRYRHVFTRRPCLTTIENICFYPTSTNFIYSARWHIR